ncbi:MAG TPA: NifB/NifX family molybdenum-iron cluster-binding protein [Clostridia bacterium]|nr:NifB/NifX family molybdenum-iron cluster-binding protein [Clostridia bacterium]
MKTSWRIAIASIDGKVINEHFGRAKEFLIIDIKPDGSHEFIERRIVTPLCSNGEHTEQALLSTVNSLRDCTAVIVSRIGIAAERALKIHNIKVFEYSDYIEEAIGKIAKYFEKTNYSGTEG